MSRQHDGHSLRALRSTSPCHLAFLAGPVGLRPSSVFLKSAASEAGSSFNSAGLHWLDEGVTASSCWATHEAVLLQVFNTTLWLHIEPRGFCNSGLWHRAGQDGSEHTFTSQRPTCLYQSANLPSSASALGSCSMALPGCKQYATSLAGR